MSSKLSDVTRPENTPLTATVINGVLYISIGIDTLAGAVITGDNFYSFDPVDEEYTRDFAISDTRKFATDVVRELFREQEDGSTPLSQLFDEVGRAAIDDGSAGVEYDQVVKFGDRHPLENWFDK